MNEPTKKKEIQHRHIDDSKCQNDCGNEVAKQKQNALSVFA